MSQISFEYKQLNFHQYNRPNCNHKRNTFSSPVLPVGFSRLHCCLLHYSLEETKGIPWRTETWSDCVLFDHMGALCLFHKLNALCVWLRGRCWAQITSSQEPRERTKIFENDTQFPFPSPDNLTGRQNAYCWTSFYMWVPALTKFSKSLR